MIGFDRTIQFNWIDSAVEMMLKGYSRQEIWTALDPIIGSVLEGKVAQRKCKTVIFRTWIRVPKEHEVLRDVALKMMKIAGKSERLAMHWGMCMVAYPFYRDFALVVGKMLRLQDEIVTDQVVRRMVESYGERSTLVRATQRLLATMKEWGVLVAGPKAANYSLKTTFPVGLEQRLVPWVVESIMYACNKDSMTISAIEKFPGFFPFVLDLKTGDLKQARGFDVTTHTGSEDLVSLVRMSRRLF